MALAVLVLEILQTRLLSVVTWYHLAFLAISLAMLGMTAGAIYTYLRPEPFEGARLAGSLARHSLLFAVTAPAAHLLMLVVRVPTEMAADAMAVWNLTAVALITAVPFFFAGVVIAAALTRIELPAGRLYGADLLGAALGCLLAVPLLDRIDPTSAVFLLGAIAALASVAFHRSGSAASGSPSGAGKGAAALALLLVAAAAINGVRYPDLLRVEVMKGRPLPEALALDRWNSHSRITGGTIRAGKPAYWSPGSTPPPAVKVRQMPLRIDGGAFTVATGFDGDAASLEWIRNDLTSLAHHIRGDGRVAVVGVGGGRDLLTALAFGAEDVTGAEINGIFLDLLTGELRDFAGLADRDDVHLVHQEGRSFLAQPGEEYDLIQMALVDTWASTAAGAMTLTENGLYTVDAWRLFLRRLAPDGVLTVSRWYAPNRPGETARLLSLATAALLEEGAESPRSHLALAGTDNLATLVVGRSPLTPRDVRRLERACRTYGFRPLLMPGRPPAEPLLGSIVAAGSLADLERATEHPYLDLSPPRDERPFFFNMLKAGTWLSGDELRREVGGVIEGNLRATEALLAILGVVAGLVLLTLIGPLLLFGRRPDMAPGRFAAGAAYFSLIGLGFMLLEIALIQRFSVVLGHPVLALSVILMSVILATGVGSFLSDRLTLAQRREALLVPLGITAVALVTALALEPLARAVEGGSLAIRVGAVLALTLPLGVGMGFAFPVGLRLVRRRSRAVLSWMWGLNGAFGVLGSILAVLLSMAWGITVCLAAGALCYLLLALPALALWRGTIPEARGVAP